MMPKFKCSFICVCGVVGLLTIALIFATNYRNRTKVKISIWGRNYGGQREEEIISTSNISILVYNKRGLKDELQTFAVVRENNSPQKFFEEVHFRCEAPFPVEWSYLGHGVVLAEIYNKRFADSLHDKSSFYLSDLVFDSSVPFIKESSGLFYCTQRKTNDSTNVRQEKLGYYDLIEINGSPLKYEGPTFHNFSKKSCLEEIQSSDVNFYFNKTEEAWFCCGDTKNTNSATIVHTYCDTPSGCKLREKCHEEKFRCTDVYNATFINESNQRCTKTNFLSAGISVGEMDCILDEQCAKYMTYKSDNKQFEVSYPMSSTQVFVAPEQALNLRATRNSDSITLICEGPNFLLEFGFKWIITKKSGSTRYVSGKDGPFGLQVPVSSALEISIDKLTNISNVTCVAPLLNSPTNWIQKSISNFLD